MRVSATAGRTSPTKAEPKLTVSRAERAADTNRSAAGARPGRDQACVRCRRCRFLPGGTGFKGFPLSSGLQQQLNMTEARCSGVQEEVKGDKAHFFFQKHASR